MKTLIVWVWAFWFAILKHISEKHQDSTIYAYEKNDLVASYLKNFKKHPFFFEWIKLGKNIIFVDKIEDELHDVDLLILSIPCQSVLPFFQDIKKYLKPGITILNLAKWINNKTLHTVWDDLKITLKWISYNYACLSGWMIASDLVKWSIIWATVWAESETLWNTIKDYFETSIFKVNIYTWKLKNSELAGALKNVFAIFTWYHEWLGMWSSSLGYFFCEYYSEYKRLFTLLWWNNDIKFNRFSIWWDLIATCFWNSRNRYLGKLVGEWKNPTEVLEQMKAEKKIAEWYETLKWIYEIIKNRDDFPITKELWKKILFPNK